MPCPRLPVEVIDRICRFMDASLDPVIDNGRYSLHRHLFRTQEQQRNLAKVSLVDRTWHAACQPLFDRHLLLCQADDDRLAFTRTVLMFLADLPHERRDRVAHLHLSPPESIDEILLEVGVATLLARLPRLHSLVFDHTEPSSLFGPDPCDFFDALTGAPQIDALIFIGPPTLDELPDVLEYMHPQLKEFHLRGGRALDSDLLRTLLDSSTITSLGCFDCTLNGLSNDVMPHPVQAPLTHFRLGVRSPVPAWANQLLMAVFRARLPMLRTLIIEGIVDLPHLLHAHVAEDEYALSSLEVLVWNVRVGDMAGKLVDVLESARTPRLVHICIPDRPDIHLQLVRLVSDRVLPSLASVTLLEARTPTTSQRGKDSLKASLERCDVGVELRFEKPVDCGLMEW